MTATASSAWQSGPPSNPTPTANGSVNGHHNGDALVNGSGSVSVGHSRKGSLMVGGGADIRRGNLAFGTVDSPNPMLSSSPAAPSITGQHLADNVRSFGSIEADATNPDSVKAPRKNSALGEAPKKAQPDIHAMFSGKPTQPAERRQSMTGQYGFPPVRPTPTPQGYFRPPIRPTGPYPPQQYMGYQQNYPGYYPQYPQQAPQYNQQWAPPQHPQQMLMSPRGQPQPHSPASQISGLPMPSPSLPQHRPPPASPNGMSTPSRPMMPGQTFTPNASTFTPQFSMSGGASTFTPRTSKAIKIARPDGTEVDLKTVAVKPAPETLTPVEATPTKKPYSLPIVVRLESEEQRKQRVKEEENREKIRAIEEAEGKERKERKERQAREAEEKRVAEEAKAEKERVEAESQQAEAQAKAEAQQKAEAQEAAETARKAEINREAERNAEQQAEPKAIGSPALTDVTEERSTVSALTMARPIEDLSSITYPAEYKSPVPGLNTDAEPGKFRYDRDFLMQFMQVCKERPDGLPSLEDIGLEADTTSGFGARGGRNGSRPPPRGPPSGAGFGRQPAQGMGAFGTGNFGVIRTTSGTNSEQRYQNSLTQPRGGRPANGGHGLPPMVTSRSQRGGPRSQRGGPRPPPPSFATDPDVAPLTVSGNSWVKARPTDKDESSPAYVERKVKALLNKLTQEKFDSISNQILEWANRSKNETDGMSLKLVIKQVFEKATDEAHWSEMYGRLCRKLLDDLDPAVTEIIDDKPHSGGVLFRKYLIGRCQMDFEAGWKAREEAVTAAAAKSLEDKERMAQNELAKEEGKDTEAAMLSDEYYAAQKAKRRGLGLVQLVGELYKLEMISTKVIRTCLVTLLTNLTDPDEEDIESTCKLLTTVGGQFEAQAGDSMAQVMQRLNVIVNLEGTSSRLRFMIMDIIDLQKNHWRSKKTQSSVMTIAQIHAQAAREQAQKSAAAAQSSRESISRGGSRGGRQRGDEWQSVQQPARLPQRPADMSNLGKISSSSAVPTFAGPSSVFSKRGKAAAATPPMSRQASTANMFSALGDTPETPAEPAAERKKLNLQPRTVPAPGEEEAGDSEDEAKPPALMSEDAAKAKIASDMKELWGEKDAGGSRNPDDIVEYYKGLPTERQHLLSVQLIDDAFRLSKYKDAEVIGKGLKRALEQEVASIEVLKKGVEAHMESLDDDSIDFPQAYKAIALFIRSLSLSDEDITILLDKVDVYGEPKVTPKDKLEKALAAVDEEN